MSLINPIPLIKALSNEDRKIVKELYYKKFPLSAKFRFRDCLLYDKFSIIEKNYFSKLFIEQDGVMVLNYSDEMMELIS